MLQKKQFINEEAFFKEQLKGYKKLHVQEILLMFFLIGYMLVGFMVINALFDASAVVGYCLQAGVELVIWLSLILIVWNGSRKGRFVFTVATLISFYGVWSINIMYDVTLIDNVSKLIRLLFVVFFICKCLTLILCTVRLYQPPICYVFETYAKEGHEAEIEDQQLIEKLFQANDIEHQKRLSKKKIERQASHNLKRYTMRYIAFLYGSLILFYFMLFFIRYCFPQDSRGIDYVQRYILLSSLYSAFIWSLPVVLMFLEKSGARVAIIIDWMLEIIRFFMTIEATLAIFETQKYGIPSIISIVFIEIIRYVWMLRMSVSFFKDPFISAFWKHKKTKR